MSKLKRSSTFNAGSVYQHPERVHLLPPPELTRLRTLQRPLAGKAKKIFNPAAKFEGRSISPFRKLPLPEIFYTNSELEEKVEDSVYGGIEAWGNNYDKEEPIQHTQFYNQDDPLSSSGQEDSSGGSLSSDREPEIVPMVSRRAILHRSRDEMQQNLAANHPDQWFSREQLYKDHINEVLDKWTNIDDSIWAKVIVLERNRRIAKAYARTPVLTVNGSQDGFDGYRIGLNGFSNPLRDSKVAQVKEDISAGCKLKMDSGGNILVKRVDNQGVYVKNTAEETAVSNDILKLPGGLLEKDRAMKLFDMKKFQQNVNREMKRQRPERNKLESQCISTLAFVRSEMDVLDCPIWIMVINIVALEMLNDKMPCAPKSAQQIKQTNIQNKYRVQTLRPQVHSSSDEDPYSLTQSGSSGYSAGAYPGTRDPSLYPTVRVQAGGANKAGARGGGEAVGGGGEDDTTGGEEGEELLEIFPGTDVDNYYSTMARQQNRDPDSTRVQPTVGFAGGEDPYYSGYSARVTDFNTKTRRDRSKTNTSKESASLDKTSPWWHSRLYPDSGVELSSVGSGGSPAVHTAKPAKNNKDGVYTQGMLRNGGFALKTKELSSYQTEKRNHYTSFFTSPRTGLFRHGWD